MSCNYYTLPLYLAFSVVENNFLTFFKFNFYLDHYVYFIYLRRFLKIFCVPFACFFVQTCEIFT